MRINVLTIAAVALLAGSNAAHADWIKGEIGMFGSFDPTGGTDLADATSLDFLADMFLVADTDGDLLGITVGQVGSLTDFQFNSLNPSPVDPLWSIGAFSFTLESINVVTQSSTFLLLKGKGILKAAGFDDTVAIWNLSGNKVGSMYVFSAGTASVPEPGTLLLLGLGLAGLGMSRRRAKTLR